MNVFANQGTIRCSVIRYLCLMQLTYLNTAATGIVPSEFTERANQLYPEMTAAASSRAEKWRDEELPVVRRHVADFLGASADCIALLPNFSWGVSGIVHSLKGDEKVMLYKGDYPSLLDPFKINGFDITWIEDVDGFTIPIDEMKQRLLNEKVNILAISHVQWMSGYKLDLADIGAFCADNGIWLIVDATQSLGAVNIDLSALPVDVLIASDYKWMNAGFGTGIMYVSKDFLQHFTPAVAGFGSYTFTDGKPQYSPSVRSFEPGHPNMFGLMVLDAAIQHKMQLGMDHIEEHDMALVQFFLDEIKNLDIQLLGGSSVENRAPFVLVRDRNGLGQLLKDNGIIVTHRMGWLRISFHYYNSEAHVKRVVEVLKNA